MPLSLKVATTITVAKGFLWRFTSKIWVLIPCQAGATLQRNNLFNWPCCARLFFNHTPCVYFARGKKEQLYPPNWRPLFFVSRSVFLSVEKSRTLLILIEGRDRNHISQKKLSEQFQLPSWEGIEAAAAGTAALDGCCGSCVLPSKSREEWVSPSILIHACTLAAAVKATGHRFECGSQIVTTAN